MREVLKPLSNRMVAAHENGLTAADLDVAGDIIAYIAHLPPPMQKDIGRLVVLFEFLPPILIFRLSRFSRLDAGRQDDYIEAWGTSRFGLLRTGFRVLKNLCVSAYYQNPATWKAIGYER